MIINGEEVKQKLLQGIDLVANTVKPTLGPQAKTVILQGNPPVVINDGVTITKYISHEDAYVQMGIQLVQNLASKAQEGSGDGTTTACILAQAICHRIMDSLGKMSVQGFNKQMEVAKEHIIHFLEQASYPVNDSGILDIATIAANNDSDMGQLIYNALAKVGRDGVVTVEESKSHLTELVVREGMEIPEGYISHLMANDEGKVVFNKPLVFLSNIPFRNFGELLPMLELAASQKRPLLILCKGMEGSSLNNLLMNILNKTVDCAVILAPNFGDAQLDELGDIQTLIGGEIYNADSKDDPTNITIDEFGTCEQVIITKEKTTFVGADGDTTSRINRLKETLKDMTGYDAGRIKSRITRLKGGIATIRVGAGSSIEMREKKERLDDALNATKAALAEGIVVGGGLTLALAGIETNNKSGYDLTWLVDALHEPIRTLISNSNLDVGATMTEIIPANGIGFNALTGKIENLQNVVDPVKVTKNSFLAAMSIAQLFYSTDVAVLLEE